MSCWNTLGIEPTPKKVLIKKAYAAKLKSHKPDEDPDGFAVLHAHYKQALNESQLYQIEDTSEPRVENYKQDKEEQIPEGNNNAAHTIISEPEVIQELETHYTHDILMTEDEESPTTEEYSYINYDAEWNEITKQINLVLANLKTANDEKNWEFLNSAEALFDIEFKAHISNYVFSQILELKKQHPRRKLPIIKTLDRFFRWTDKRDILEAHFGFQRVQLLLGAVETIGNKKLIKWTSTKSHNGPMFYPNYYARLGATTIDIIIISFAQYYLALAAQKLGINNSLIDTNSFLRVLVLYTFLIPIMESSPLQGALGKILLGIKVTNKEGRRLNIFQAFWRNISYMLSTAGFKITVWINMFTNDGRMLHDRLSKSLVIKR